MGLCKLLLLNLRQKIFCGALLATFFNLNLRTLLLKTAKLTLSDFENHRKDFGRKLATFFKKLFVAVCRPRQLQSYELIGLR